jgi:hypothetical protein
VRFARKPPHVAHDAHDLRGQDRSHAENLGEGGARGLHLLPDALVQIGDPPVEGANVTHYLGGQLLSGSRRFVPWSDSPQQPGGGIGTELLADGVGEKVPQQHVQTVQGASALGNQILAPLREQPENLDVSVVAVLG